MSTGGFKEPPAGPNVGATKEFDRLPQDQREELGDLDALQPTVMKPMALPEGADADGLIRPSPLPEPSGVKIGTGTGIEPLLDEPVSRETTLEEDVEHVEAAFAVLEEEEEVDPEELAARPDEAARQEFMRCILGDAAYVKEFSLFGGMIVLKLRDLSPSEEDKLYAQMSVDQREGRIESQDDWELMLSRYRLMYATDELLWSGRADEKSRLPADATAHDRVEEMIGTYKNSTIYRAVLRASRIFRLHLEQLYEKALDPNFWEAVGSDSPSEPTSAAQSTTEPQAASADGN